MDPAIFRGQAKENIGLQVYVDVLLSAIFTVMKRRQIHYKVTYVRGIGCILE